MGWAEPKGLAANPLQPVCFQHPRSWVSQTRGLKAEYKVSSFLEEVPGIEVDARQSCSLENYLDLPDHTMDDRIAAARAKLGSRVLLLGHHYQRDEVIRFADYTGDSYKLSKIAAETEAEYI